MTNLINAMITVVINTKCNQSCAYCPPMGESHMGVSGELPFNLADKIIRLLIKQGAKMFRFTGGEPTLHSEFNSYLNLMTQLVSGSIEIQLNTNGSKLIEPKKLAKLSKLRISLDSLNENKYRKITNSSMLEDIVKNIVELKKNKASIEILMVLMKYNQEDVLDILEFCSINQCDLKLCDLEEHEYDGVEFFHHQYQTVKEVEQMLLKKGCTLIKEEGLGLGLTMKYFEYRNILVKIKTKQTTATYLEFCRKCRIFPCPEGVFTLLIQPDGTLSFCRRNRSANLSIKGIDENKLEQAIEKFCQQLSGLFPYEKNMEINPRITNKRHPVSSIKIIPIDKSQTSNNQWCYQGNQNAFKRNAPIIKE